MISSVSPLRRIVAAAFLLCLSPARPVLYAAAGDLYTKDFNDSPIIRIAQDGTKTVFAPSDGSQTTGIAFDRAGNLYVASAAGGNILKFAPDGTKTTFAAGLDRPYSLAFDAAGNLFVSATNSIFKFAPDGTKTVFASGLSNPAGLAFDRAGNLFLTQGSAGPVLKFSPDGTSSVFAPSPDFSHPFLGIALDAADNVYIAEFVPGTIYKYSPDGKTRTVFSPPANSSTGSIEFDSAGNLFSFVEGQGSIYKITPNGTRTLFASNLGFAAWGAFEPARGYSVNLSTRLRVQTEENVMIAGFIGADPTTVVIRGIGPSLAQADIKSALQDPVLELHDSTGAVIKVNDNWRETQETELQASGLAPKNDFEAAMLVTLPPGAYTAIIRGKNFSLGVGLIEIYDLNQASHAKLVNLSTRGRVETGENVMIGGFIVGGNGEKVLLRALGPSLLTNGVLEPLLDPTLTLFNSNGSPINSNNNWKDTHEIAIRGTGMAPPNDLESAILTTLPPGQYTVVVQDHNGLSGVAVIELYNLN
jgi:sugar lactone lactonase YvrE